jgi:RNA recognition motif-containing protein
MPVPEEGSVFQNENVNDSSSSSVGSEIAVAETTAEDKTSLSSCSEEENTEAQDRNESTSQSCKVYVGGLDENTTEEKLRALLEPCGEIVDCHLKGDSSRTKWFAFVTFSNSESVQTALEEHANEPFCMDDHPIDLRQATPRNHGNKGRPIIRQKNKLFIGGLSAETTEEDLLGHFAQYGSVLEAELKYDKVTNRHRGFGFVTFETCDSAQDACRKNYQEIRGKKVEIKEALPPELLGTAKTKKTPYNSGYHGYQSVMPPYAMYSWCELILCFACSHHLYAYLYTHLYMHLYTRLYTHLYICLYTHMYTCLSTHLYTHLYTCLYSVGVYA